MHSTQPKRKSIDLLTKVSIINQIESGASQTAVSSEHNLPKQTVNRIWKNRDAIKENASTLKGNLKKVRPSSFPTVEKALTDWFLLQRHRNVSINGPLLKEKALNFAKIQNIPDFEASDSWLRGWASRHGFSAGKVICGEAKSVNIETVNHWLETDWKRISVPFSARDIYNTDETALFYKLLPDRTYDYKNKPCVGGKSSKERLTLLLCCNMDGSDKLKPLIIGKSAKPRCFSGIRDLTGLPVIYESNKTAWMNSTVFSRWLKQINLQMRLQNRNILLLMDSAPPHVAADADLSNVKIAFFPVNATSEIQPLDQGIIQSFKRHYRTMLVKKIIHKLDHDQGNKIDVLEAIHMTASAWNSVTPKTIANCFRHAKLFNSLGQEDLLDDNSEAHDLAELLPRLNENPNVVDDYVSVDNHVAVFQVSSEEEIALNALPTNDEAEENSEEEEESMEIEQIPISTNEAISCIQTLRHYVTCNGSATENDPLFKSLNDLERFAYKKKSWGMRQRSILEYVNK